jgi:ureidoglycolate lyase
VRRLPIEPLTRTAFRPFGDVIETRGRKSRTINEGFADRFHDLAGIDVAAGGGKPILSIFRARQRPAPIVIGMLERHPLGSQAFVPIEPHPWLVVTAEGDDKPNLRTLRCFRARGDQGINYAVGTWHFPVLVLVPEQQFLVVDREGPGTNLEEVWFAPGREVRIEPG